VLFFVESIRTDPSHPYSAETTKHSKINKLYRMYPISESKKKKKENNPSLELSS
jgi:hypothetical protein